MSIYQESRRPGEFIKSEGPGRISRDAITLEAGHGILAPGAVLARRQVADSVGVAAGVNTGDGALGAVTTGKAVEIGTYLLDATAPTKFDLTTPSGDKLKGVTVGSAYASTHLSFTVSAGGAAFVPGDSFTVTVAAGTGKFAPLDPAADDGGQIAAAILYAAADTSAETSALAIARLAEVTFDRLVWPDGITAAQQSAAVTALADRFIIAR